MPTKSKVFIYGVATLICGVATATAYFRFKNKTAFPAYILGNKLPLASTEQLAHNVKLLKFQLPSNVEGTGIKPGSASLSAIKHPVSGRTILRPYSVIYWPEDPHKLVFAIKMQNKDGASGAMNSIEPGYQVRFRGPKPGKSVDLSKVDSVNLIAGGSGITPIYSVLKYLLLNKPTSKVNLIFANKTEDDIMFKKDLDRLQKENPDRFSLTYVLDQGVKGENTAIGRITPELLKERIWKNTPVYLCGSNGMIHELYGKRNSALRELAGKDVFVFN